MANGDSLLLMYILRTGLQYQLLVTQGSWGLAETFGKRFFTSDPSYYKWRQKLKVHLIINAIKNSP